MQSLILTNKGLEEESKRELKRLINTNANENEEHLIIYVNNREELYKLAYLGRSYTRVLEIIEETDNPLKGSYKVNFDKTKTISIEVRRTGNHKFNSGELYNLAARKIREQGYTIQKHPDITLFLYVKDKKSYFCIDYSGFDLGKREYRVFTSRDAIKGNIAAGILLGSGLVPENPEKILLDPFCRDGTIAIEAALIAKNQSPHYHDKEKFSFLKIFDESKGILEKMDTFNKAKQKTIIASDTNFANISAAKKNATIADAVKSIRFLHCAIDNIDLKFEKEIDLIVTVPLQPGRTIPEKAVRKTAEQFFNRAKEVLSLGGKIVLALKRGQEIYEEAAKEQGFEVRSKKEIMQGEEKIRIFAYTSY